MTLLLFGGFLWYNKDIVEQTGVLLVSDCNLNKGGDGMKKEKRKGYAAPIVITVILLAYFAIYFGVLIAVLPGVWKYVLLIVPIALSGVLIYVCRERIQEIRSGEADDLSQY